MSSQEIRISGQVQINMQRNWRWLFGIIVVLNVGKVVQRRKEDQSMPAKVPVRCYGLQDPTTRQKNNRTVQYAKQQLRTCITLFCTFLYRFCTTTSWKCLILHFMENVNRQRRNFISLSELGYPPRFPWNSTSGGFTYIWQRVGNNKHDKDWKNANSLFKRHSRCSRVIGS